MENFERKPTREERIKELEEAEKEYLKEFKEKKAPLIINALESASKALPPDHVIQQQINELTSLLKDESRLKDWKPTIIIGVADALSERIKSEGAIANKAGVETCRDAYNQLLQSTDVIAVAPKEGSLLDNDRRIKLRSGVVGEGRYLVVQTVYSSGYYYPQTGTWLKLPEVFMALHDRPPSGDSDIMIDHLGKKYKIDERGNLLPKEDSEK